MNSFQSKGNYSLKIIQDSYKSLCKINESDKLPILLRKPDKLLVENWWAERPFDNAAAFAVPIFNFQSGKFINKTVDLEKNIFNVPLRRDLIKRTLTYLISYIKV